MPKNSKLPVTYRTREARFWLQCAVGLLAVLNLVALYLYLAPPGGSQRQLTEESAQTKSQIAAARLRTNRLRSVSEKVEQGSSQATKFEGQSILAKRTAYATVISEIQRMANSSGLQERDASYSEEPIEGTADLTLVNSTANYEGSYENLRRFLNEVDHSPMLIMLENLQAAPQQRSNQISASIRFQAVIREDGVVAEKGQP